MGWRKVETLEQSERKTISGWTSGNRLGGFTIRSGDSVRAVTQPCAVIISEKSRAGFGKVASLRLTLHCPLPVGSSPLLSLPLLVKRGA